MSWETLAAGQQLGAASGEPVAAVVVGKGIASLAAGGGDFFMVRRIEKASH